MSSFLFEFPTTGAISFADFCVDPGRNYATELSESTQSRANLRAALKEIKRSDGEKDNLKLVKVLDDYLPYLCGIIGCTVNDELVLKSTPTFSWRTTLSSHMLSSSPRLTILGLPTDLAFSLLTYAFALCNLARANVFALGTYEHERTLSEAERKAKDDKLNFAVTLLCKASGIFQHISDVVIGEWEATTASTGSQRPLELTREVALALAKMSLADAQVLAIRKLLSKAAAETAMSPGPPLPKSHPAPALIAKLHLEASALYASSRALAKTPSASKPKTKISLKSSKDHDDDAVGGVEVSGELRRYLADQSTLHAALAHKWLGVDAGESKGEARAGEAVGWLAWARKELEEIKDGGAKALAGSREKDMRESRKGAVTEEAQAVEVFWKHYKKLNDSLSFQPVPSQAELQSLVPSGRLAVAARPYIRPTPAFGPGSVDYIRRQAEELELANDHSDRREPVDGLSAATSHQPSGSYVGSGAYF